MANHMQRWTLGLDKILWESRDCEVQKLAEYFGRTNGSITSRLQSLREPTNAAHQQLSQYYGKPIGARKLKCATCHVQCSPALLQLIVNGHDISSLGALNKGKKWSRSDDVCLWNNRDCPVQKLASHHGRTAGGIRRRLELLVDPNSTPRQRLFPSTTETSTVQKVNKSVKSKKKRNRDFDEFDDLLSQRATKRQRVEKVKTPQEYLDPVTFSIMKDPVMVTVSGYTYEKATILKCIRDSGKDPFTQIRINSSHLVPNRALKAGIDRWKRENAK